MNNPIPYLIGFIGFFVFDKIFKSESLIVLVLFLILTTVGIVWVSLSVLNKDYEADIKFRSQRKTFDFFKIGILIFLTLFVIFFINHDVFYFYMIALFWVGCFVDFIMSFVYKARKPYTIFIKDNQLILSSEWTRKRDLTELTNIYFDRFSKNLILYFKTNSRVYIKTTAYQIIDIQKLLEILIKKSNQEVFVPENYKAEIEGNY